MENQVSMNLMSMKECSPMMAFAVYVVVTGVTLFMTRNSLKSYGDEKIDNLYSLYSWHEVKYIIVMGILLYGLCQYKKENLAWISLTIPLLYLILKNMYVFIQIFTVQQNVPVQKKVVPPKKDMKKIQQEIMQQQQEEIQKQQVQQQRLQQQKMQQHIQSHYQQPVNKDIGGLTPPLNSYDPSANSNLSLF